MIYLFNSFKNDDILNMMVDFLACLCISVLTGFGLSILLVEKGKDWPIKPYRIILQLFLSKIHWKLPQMLLCTTCTSFWASLIADIIVAIIALCHGVAYFFWPFSGAVTAGFTWVIIEYLNSIDKEPNINVFVDNTIGENKNEDLPTDNHTDDSTVL